MTCRASRPDGDSRGFARLELAVLLATLALLAAVTRPVWGNASQPGSLMCMDNLRRLSAAWLLYTEEAGGRYVGNYHGGFIPGATATERPWVTGWLDWTVNPDNTNTVFLTANRYAALSPYLEGDATAYRCPADEYVSSAQAARRWSTRVRSYAMNGFLGEGNQSSGPLNPAYLTYRGPAGFRHLSPRQVYVFVEEHPDSINDGLFWAPNQSPGWVDLPASLHAGAAWFTFADGHLESHRWESTRTVRPVTASGFLNLLPASADDPDPAWVLQHASERK